MATNDPGTAASLGLLLVRLGSGAMLIYGHGWPKLMHWAERMHHFPDPLGVGSPRSLALAIFAEVVCALCVMLGFGTRFACVPILVTMAVAAFMVNGGQPFAERELALIYAMPFLALAATGPGRFALDARFGPRLRFGGGK